MLPWSKNASVLWWLLLGTVSTSWAQSIFTCVDAKGRHLTADRPIVDCTDREQKELNPSGTVKRTVGPVLTAQELAIEEERARKIAHEKSRRAEKKKRDRALLVRYPNRASHDKERQQALTTVNQVIALANKNVADLTEQRKSSAAALAAYQDSAQAPPTLSYQVEEIDRQIEMQQRVIATQLEQRQRINGRYDQELQRLEQLWGQQAQPVPASDTTPR